MKHIHFVIKHKPHEMRNDRNYVSFVEECGEPTRHKSNSKTPTQCAFALHSKPLMIKFNKGLSNVYIPTAFEVQKKHTRSKQGQRSCPSCSHNKNQKLKKSRTKKVILNADDVQYKLYEPPREVQPRNRIREQKSRPKKKFDVAREEKNKLRDVENKNARPTNRVSFLSPDDNINLQGNRKNRRNERKLKKLYENEAMLKPENRKPNSIPIIRKTTRPRKCKQQFMQITQSENPGCRKELDTYKNKVKYNKRVCKKMCHKNCTKVQFPIKDSVAFIQSSPDVTSTYKECIEEQREPNYEVYEEDKNVIPRYQVDEEDRNLIQEFQSNDYPSNTCIEENQRNMEFEVIKPHVIKDSLEVIQTNGRKGITRSSSESVSMKAPNKPSLRNKMDENKRGGRKIAFANIQSYRTFDSHEPPSKIGDLKTENVAQLTEQDNSVVISNAVIPEPIPDVNNYYNEALDQNNNDNYQLETNPPLTPYDEVGSMYSWSSLLSQKSFINNDDIALLGDNNYEQSNNYEESNNLPNLPNSLQSVSLKVSYSSCNSFSSSKSFPCTSSSPMALEYTRGKQNMDYMREQDREDLREKDIMDYARGKQNMNYMREQDREDLREKDIMDYDDYYPKDFKKDFPSTIKASPNFRRLYYDTTMHTENVANGDFYWNRPSFRGYSEMTKPAVYNTERMSMPLKPTEYKRSYTTYRKPMSKSYTYNNPRTQMKSSMYQRGSFQDNEVEDNSDGAQKTRSRGFHYQYKPFSFCRPNMRNY
ncbi:hypothetical protein WDU94_005325 [Cyamophila willieti]